MKTIQLTTAQLDAICRELDGISADGRFDIDVCADDNTNVSVRGCLDIDGYVEDDFHCGYMNGTGAFVETSRIAYLDDMTAEVYDAERDEWIACDVAPESWDEVELYLKSA